MLPGSFPAGAAAAKAFGAAAAGDDLAATGTAMKKLGGTCKGCHDKFRAED